MQKITLRPEQYDPNYPDAKPGEFSQLDLEWLYWFKHQQPKTKEDKLSLFFENPRACKRTLRWRRRRDRERAKALASGKPVEKLNKAGLPKEWKSMEPIVVSMVQRYCLPSCSREDLIQAGWAGVGKALATWKKGKGSSITTWAYLHVRKAVTVARAKEMTLSGIGPAAWRRHGADLYAVELPEEDVLVSQELSPCEHAIRDERNGVLLDCYRRLNRKYRKSICEAFTARMLGLSWRELKIKFGRDMRVELRKVEADARRMMADCV